MLNLPVSSLFVDPLSIASTLRWPVVACVAGWSAGGGEMGSASRQQCRTFEDAVHSCPELIAGKRTLQPLEMELQLYGQTLLHFCGFFSLTGRSVGKPETAQHQKCTEGGKKARFLQNLGNIIQVSKGML